ncbi:MAG TPA: hypothetical protein VGP46_00560 [Acidimicrobiales bacterium]|nr:hypothetical protein [Acidimicrobiales bacterium]
MAQLSTPRLRAVLVLLASGVMGAQALAALPAVATTTSSYGFDSPDAAVLSGPDLFVANSAGKSVTEVSASTGALVRILSGAAYHFDDPVALVALGGDVFVASSKNNTVTELAAATGDLVRTIISAKDLDDPVAMVTEGTSHLFVLDQGGSGAVTELSVSTGKLVAMATGAGFGFDRPTAITLSQDELFVPNSDGNSVTEINATTMKLVRVISASSYGFSGPTGVATHGGNVWVSNLTGESITELQASNGALVQVVTSDESYLPTPDAIAYGAGHVFVASPPGGSPMITQVVPENPAQLPWMMCNTNAPYTFSNPQALVTYGTTLWVVNEGGAGGPAGNSLTEMNADSGTLIKVVS